MGIAERVLFLKQLKENFIHTGSITPSSQFLAKGVVSEWMKHTSPSKILEVGPGTGSITREIARWMKPGDILHICEINTLFAEHIDKIIKFDAHFSKTRSQVQVFNQSVQTLMVTDHYDFIISSLPLNNFDYHLVKEILHYYESFLTNGGILSYFEYIAVRQMKIGLTNGKERARLVKLDLLLHDFLKKYEMRTQFIPLNIPPACIHHLKF
jgi:phospholipid N-methyltransferase